MDSVYFENQIENAVARIETAAVGVKSGRTSFQNFLIAICTPKCDASDSVDTPTVCKPGFPAQTSSALFEDYSSDTGDFPPHQHVFDVSAHAMSTATASVSESVSSGHVMPFDTDNLILIHDETAEKAVTVSEAFTDASLSTLRSCYSEVAALVDDAITKPETPKQSEELGGDALSSSLERECLDRVSITPSDVECGTSCTPGPPSAADSFAELTLSDSSVPTNELDSGIQEVYEEKEHSDAAFAEPAPLSDLAEVYQLKKDVQKLDIVDGDEGLAPEGCSDHDLQVKEKSVAVFGVLEFSANATKIALDSAQFPSLSQATILDDVEYEKLTRFNDNEVSVESETIDLPIEKDLPFQIAEPDPIAIFTARAVKPAATTEAPCKLSDSEGQVPLDTFGTESVEPSEVGCAISTLSGPRR